MDKYHFRLEIKSWEAQKIEDLGFRDPLAMGLHMIRTCY